jgi:hypothetical protein
MRNSRLMLAASGLATVALLGSSAMAYAASPKVVNGPDFTTDTAGYQINSAVPFNEVRATIHVSPGDTTDGVLALQSNVNGGHTVVFRLHEVGGGYILQVANDPFVVNTQSGVFDPSSIPAFLWRDIASPSAPAGGALVLANTGGSAYLEIHESTATDTLAFVEGPSETDVATLGLTFNFSGKLPLNAPVVEGWNGDATDLGLNEPEINFTRVGVTEPAGHNVGGIAGTRVTFDFFNVDQVLATRTGAGPTVTNPLALVTGPSLPQTSSDFGLVGGAL